MRFTANLTLWGIVAAILAALYLMLYVGQSAQEAQQAKVADLAQRKSNLQTKANDDRKKLDEVVAGYPALEKAAMEAGVKAQTAKEKETIAYGSSADAGAGEPERMEWSRRKTESEDAARKLSDATSEQETLRRSIAETEELVRTTDKLMVDAIAGTSVKDVTTLIIRVAIGVILIFLVQILVGIYRYASRMAAFYQGRADVLLIASQAELEKVPVKDLVDWFAGDKLVFDKAPKAPTEKVLEIAQKVADTTVAALAKQAGVEPPKRDGGH